MYKKILIFMLCLCLSISLFSGCMTVSEETTAPKETVPANTTAPGTQPPAEPQPTDPPETTRIPETTEPAAGGTEPMEPQYSFVLTDKTVTFTKKGQSLQLYCGDVPLNEISWFSADESIALFSQGTVVALDQGTTVVYAKYRDEIIFCEVVCDVDPDAPAPYVNPKLHQAPRMGIPYLEDPQNTAFFDDAAFIGDSVSYVLQQWSLKNGNFGDAAFLTRSSLGLQNSIDGRIGLSYQGKSYRPEDALALAGKSKLFVMLGFNDLAVYGIDGTMERWVIFIDRILEKNPDMEIYIQSCTPVHKSSEYNRLNNDIIDEYNVQLAQYCRENGYHFVNIAPYFKDFHNSLVGEYCSDARMHITYDGALVWEYALKAYGEEQLRNMEGENQ